MTTIYLNYFLNDEDEEAKQLLGVEELNSIGEALIPDCSENGHKVSITKFFDGQECHRWLVKKLVHDSNSETSIFLAPWLDSGNEEFLNQTRKSNHRVISSLQLGTLVEVDFGYIPKVKKSNGNVRTNKRYPDSIHHGEMHKRRLCVVVKADPNRVQVVPLTSKDPGSGGDLSNSSISHQSLQSLVGYGNPEIQSYAICRMIKTVAPSRILPPLARQRGTRSAYRDIRYVHRLRKGDKKAFKLALSHVVGLGDYEDLKKKLGEVSAEVDDLNDSNQRLEGDLDLKNAANEELRKREQALVEMLTDCYRKDANEPIGDVKSRVEQDISEYLAILDEA